MPNVNTSQAYKNVPLQFVTTAATQTALKVPAAGLYSGYPSPILAPGTGFALITDPDWQSSNPTATNPVLFNSSLDGQPFKLRLVIEVATGVGTTVIPSIYQVPNTSLTSTNISSVLSNDNLIVTGATLTTTGTTWIPNTYSLAPYSANYPAGYPQNYPGFPGTNPGSVPGKYVTGTSSVITTSGSGTGATFNITTVNAQGLITAVSVSGGGSGYAVGDLIYLTQGSAVGAVLTVASLSTTAVATVTLTSGGYAAYQYILETQLLWDSASSKLNGQFDSITDTTYTGFNANTAQLTGVTAKDLNFLPSISFGTASPYNAWCVREFSFERL
jgi:hypothetical protein